MFYRVAFFGILTSIVSLNSPILAQNCSPIPVVGGQGNSVTKTVSPPTIPAGPLGMLGINITSNNWNTDWAVPGGAKFRRYVVTVTSNDGGIFDIKMYLKYSDQTSDEFFNTEGVQLQPNQPLIIKGTPRPQDQPFQVNLFVNGVRSIGNTYTASVVGCYR
jgi:hypothetical protein